MTQRGGGVGVAPSGLVSSFDGHVGAVTLANTDLDRVRAIVSKTANYTAADGDYVVGDTTGGAFTVTLPAAVAGGYIVVELRTGSAALTVHNLLGGDVVLTGARAGALCFSDGTNWHAIVSEGSGTYVPKTKGRVAWIGNSITSGAGAVTEATFVSGQVGGQVLGGDPAEYAMMVSAGNWETVVNAGLGGNTSAQMLARLQADVLSLAPSVVVLGELFRNDVTTGVAKATSLANMTAMVTACIGAGAVPVLTTMIGGFTGDGTSVLHQIAALNKSVIEYGLSHGIPVVDWHDPLIDPTTGLFASSYIGISSHPNDAANLILGQHVATALDALCPASPSSLVNNVADGTVADLMNGNGLFLGAPTGGIAGNWLNYPGLASGCTASIVTDSLVRGNMQELSCVATTGTSGIAYNDGNNDFVGKYAIGDVLEISCVVTSNGGVQPRILWAANGSVSPYGNLSLGQVAATVTRGKVKMRFKVPVGTTGMSAYLYAGAGTGIVAFGQFGVRNLTALGAVV